MPCRAWLLFLLLPSESMAVKIEIWDGEETRQDEEACLRAAKADEWTRFGRCNK